MGPPPGYHLPPPRPVAPNGEPLAEFTDRLLARLIDGAILAGVSMIIAIPMVIAIVAVISNQADSTSPDAGPSIFMIFALYGAVLLLILVAGYIYEVEMTSRTGQTVGKRVMKIRTVPLDGTPINRGFMARRWLATSIANLIPFFGGIYAWLDGLWQLWDQPFRQCLHDKYAKTVVVKKTPVGPA